MTYLEEFLFFYILEEAANNVLEEILRIVSLNDKDLEHAYFYQKNVSIHPEWRQVKERPKLVLASKCETIPGDLASQGLHSKSPEIATLCSG